MSWLDDLIGSSPFGAITEHTKRVHACVELLKEAAAALVNEDYDKIMELHHEISKQEHEADQVKNDIRKHIFGKLFLAVDKEALTRFLSAQDDVADRAEDFVVVLTLRKTKIAPALREEFMTLVDAVVKTSETLLAASEEIKSLSERSFSGKHATEVLKVIESLGEKEWECDKLQRRFARHFYSLESELDSITIIMYDKYNILLGRVANAAEKAGKYLRAMIEKA